MKLLKLELNNFKGIKHFELDTGGGDVSVYGRNETGKTTLADAFYWLLYGKDSNNKKDFAIKTLIDGKVTHGLDHSVEAILEVGGEEITLKKVYKELWTKKRGSTNKIFSGHTTEYFFNDVPSPKQLFDDHVKGICLENNFKLLTSPVFFNEQLSWQERRINLMDVCGNITDADVIASKKELSELPEILGSHKLDDYREIIKARRTAINKEIEKIPVRIDEINLGLPDITGLDKDEIKGKIVILEGRKNKKQAEIVRIENGGQIAEKTKALREVESKILELQNKQVEAGQGAKNELRETYFAAKTEITDYGVNIVRTKRQIASNDADIKRLMAQKDTVAIEYREAQKSTFEFSQESVCPACGQDLPKAKLEAARKAALEAFNLKKSNSIEGLNAEGKELKQEIDDIAAKKPTFLKAIEQLEIKIKAAEVNRDKLQSEIEQCSTDTAESPELEKAIESKAALKEVIEQLKKDSSQMLENIRDEIGDINSKIRQLEVDFDKFEVIEKFQVRIDELGTEEKKLAGEYEELESHQFITDEFIRAKVGLLEGKINNKFKLARFKMFEEQINGGVKEVCETTYKGVPYSSLNNGAKIAVGIDIINTLSNHFDFSGVIFIDNRESITEPLITDSQTISLIVSKADKKLRIETENQSLKEAI